MAPRLRLAAGIALAAALIPAAAAFSTPPPPLRPGPACAVRREPAASLGAPPAHLRSSRAASLRMSGARGSRGDNEEEESKSEIDRDRMLPQPYIRSDNGTRDSEFALARVGGGEDEEVKNQYVKWLESLTPGEMVGQFMATAPPRVQSAVKNTVIGLLGSLRASTAFDASVVTTQRALASLMFQLEMTGYMFRNAEYRLALQKTLLEANAPELPGADPAAGSVRPQLKGSITVTLPDGTDVEVDANAYVSELSKEVESLKAEMVSLRLQEEENKLQDLLAYVQNLESEEMASLSSQVSAEVLDAMRQLVDTVIRGMGGDVAIKEGYDILTEVPSGTLAQLCMWQLVVGYNLREMEAREELNKQLSAGEDDDSPESRSDDNGAGGAGK